MDLYGNCVNANWTHTDDVNNKMRRASISAAAAPDCKQQARVNIGRIELHLAVID